MKLLTTLALSVTLTAGAFSVQAADQSEQALAQCIAELQAHYGEHTELNLVERRRNQHGTRMRVAVKLDADNAYFANCWVARTDAADFDSADDSPMFASSYQVVISH